MQTIIYRIENQQSPTIQHRKLYSNIVINHNGKQYENECILCVYIYIHTHTHTHTHENSESVSCSVMSDSL